MVLLKTRLPPISIYLTCKNCRAFLHIYLDEIKGSPESVDVECFQCKSQCSISYKSLSAADKYGKIEVPSSGVFLKNSVALVSDTVGDYYEILGISKSSTSDEIKKAYYKLAMKYHPDKYTGSDTKENEDRFKLISEAYQILSDENLRSRYDRYGREDRLKPEGGFADPEKFFKDVFGGDRFGDIIGDLTISRDLGDAMNSTQPQSEAAALSPEERERQRNERVKKLATNLLHKINYFVGSSEESVEHFKEKIRDEAEELKMASYGVELLHAIGFMYSLKSRQWLGKEDTLFGIGKFWNDVREKGHMISETFGTIKSAVELQSTLSKLQESEEASRMAEEGTTVPSGKKTPKLLTAEEKAKLEEIAAKKGLDTLWKGSKMEVESVIKDVCDLVLGGKSVSDPTGPITETKLTLRKRAQAIGIIGKIYESVKTPE